MDPAAKRRAELSKLLRQIGGLALRMGIALEEVPEYSGQVQDDFADLTTVMQLARTELHHYRMSLRQGGTR